MEKIYSYMEAAVGFGTIIGPPVGSFFFNLFGIGSAFYFVSFLFFVAFLQTLFLVPDMLNKSNSNLK